MQIEIIGIIATLFIICAFLQNGEGRIRTLDLIGAILFIIYGVCIRSFSTILLNGILVGVQIYKLCGLYINKEEDTLEDVN